MGRITNKTITSAEVQTGMRSGSTKGPFSGRGTNTATVVYAGMEIKEIERVNTQLSTFESAFLLWFRWTGKAPQNLDFVFPHGEVLIKRELRNDFFESASERYLLYDMRVKFDVDLQFFDYPLDSQTLILGVKLKNAAENQFTLVRDPEYEMHPLEKQSFGFWKETRRFFYVDARSEVDEVASPANEYERLNRYFSVLTLELAVARHSFAFVFKLLPLLILLVVNFLVFFIKPETFPPRVTLGVTALLSAIAFHISQSNQLQNVGYLIKADWFFVATYLLIFLTISESILVNAISNSGNHFISLIIDRISAFVFPIITFSAIYFIYA
jgi:hypothetical protein